jgi:hypothetical protein
MRTTIAMILLGAAIGTGLPLDIANTEAIA